MNDVLAFDCAHVYILSLKYIKRIVLFYMIILQY